MRYHLFIVLSFFLVLSACEPQAIDEKHYTQHSNTYRDVYPGPSYRITGVVNNSKTKKPITGYRITVLDDCHNGTGEYIDCNTSFPGEFEWIFTTICCSSLGCGPGVDGNVDLYILKNEVLIGRIPIEWNSLIPNGSVFLELEFDVPPIVLIEGTGDGIEKEDG